MKVRKVVSKMQLGRIYRLSHSTDPITHCIMRRRFGQGKFKRLSLAAKGWLDKVPKWSEYRTGDEVREIAEGNGLNCPREFGEKLSMEGGAGYGLKALVYCEERV